MKKLLTLIIAITTLLSTTAFAAEQDKYTSRGEAVYKIVQYMYDLSFDEPYSIKDTYCMHEERSMRFTPSGESSYPMLGAIYSSMGWNGFSDISSENENAIALNLAKEMKLIDGFGDSTFRANDAVTFGQAVKMLVCALGYRDKAISDGGYPNGFIKVADEIGLIKNINLDAKITAKEFETLLKTAFNLEHYPTKSILRTMPTTAEDCVTMYAEAIKSRNGLAQYALLSDALKFQMEDDFIGLNWVTGASSPWVTGYDVNKINDFEYIVAFHYSTSTGPCDDVLVPLTMELFQYAEYKIVKNLNETTVGK